MKNVDYLKQELKVQRVSQSHFAKQYYLEEVDEHASPELLDAHYVRFKSLLKSKDPRSPERIMAYINYFDRRYKNDNRFTQADRSAAWEMLIELDTRVATRSLEGGDSASALGSLAVLFKIHRDNAKRHGPNSKQYYGLVTEYIEGYLRPFTSKWHTMLDKENDAQFRHELEEVQIKLIELKSLLESMSS